MADAHSVKVTFYGQEVEVFLTQEQYDLIKSPGEYSLVGPPQKKEQPTMSVNPVKPPDQVEVGQMWKDNDERTVGSGEFVVEEIVGGKAIVRRTATGRRTKISPFRLLNTTGKRGYSYLGKKR